MTYQPDVCVYHSPCLDGFTAAWAIHRRWPGCDFIPANYDEPITLDPDGKHILFVDFSLPAEGLSSMIDEGKAASIVVLDHHKTGEAALFEFAKANDAEHLNYILEHAGEEIEVWFDMTKSGARMAWEFAHPGSVVPDIVRYVEDRDLWRFTFPETKAICAALSAKRQSFAEWDQLMFHMGTLDREGQIILAAHEAFVKELCEEAYTGHMSGHDGVVFINVPAKLASDVGHELLARFPEAPFVATWSRFASGMVKFSLRSEDSRVDVSEVAQKFAGGGGHRNAARFNMIVTRMPPEHPAV